jgi:endoglucanase
MQTKDKGGLFLVFLLSLCLATGLLCSQATAPIGEHDPATAYAAGAASATSVARQVLPVKATYKVQSAKTAKKASKGGAPYLYVKGNAIYYHKAGKTKKVVLRGVNVGDFYHFTSVGERVPSFKYIRSSLNATAVRLACHPLFWRTARKADLARLHKTVKSALAAGLFVIIDYHTIGFPNGTAQKIDGNLYDAHFSLCESFWKTISKDKLFKDRRILFELWNEPSADLNHDGTPDGDYSAKAWGKLKPYWQKLIKIIRVNKAKNIVIAAGDGWAGNFRGVAKSPLKDPNVAYAWHIYTNYTDSYASYAWQMDGLYKKKPVIVTEWGYETSQYNKFKGLAKKTDPFLKGYLKAKGLSSFAWCYCPWYTPCMLANPGDPDFKKLNAWGKYVKAYLRSYREVFA